MSRSMEEFLQKETWQTTRSLWDTVQHARGRAALKAAPQILLEIVEMLAESHRSLHTLLLESASPAPTTNLVESKLTQNLLPPDDFRETNESVVPAGEPPPAPAPAVADAVPRMSNGRLKTRKFRENAGRYTTGMWAGLYPRSLVTCRGACGRAMQAFLARKEGWPQVDLCAQCSPLGVVPPEPTLTAAEPVQNRLAHGLSPEVVRQKKFGFPWPVSEDGFVLEGPFKNLTLAQSVSCRRCRMRFRVYMAKNWPEINLCRDCGEILKITAEAQRPDPPEQALGALATLPSLAEEREISRRTRAQYTEGPLAGLWPRTKVKCRECGRAVYAFVARQEGWPESNLCANHQNEKPWAGIAANDTVTCSGCGKVEPMEAVRSNWPLPDLCDTCSQMTEPEPPAPPALEPEPVCSECQIEKPQPGTLLCVACTLKSVDDAVASYKKQMAAAFAIPNRQAEPEVPENGANGSTEEKQPNPFSKKRATPARGDENNWRIKRLAERLRRG